MCPPPGTRAMAPGVKCRCGARMGRCASAAAPAAALPSMNAAAGAGPVRTAAATGSATMWKSLGRRRRVETQHRVCAVVALRCCSKARPELRLGRLRGRTMHACTHECDERGEMEPRCGGQEGDTDSAGECMHRMARQLALPCVCREMFNSGEAAGSDARTGAACHAARHACIDRLPNMAGTELPRRLLSPDTECRHAN
eukprot:352834-Chlamydomonas_euryale.AAC.5